MIEYNENSEKEGLLISLDIENAFPPLNRSYMGKSLEYYEFGEKVRPWINLVYNETETVILNNECTIKRIK